jgi:hypothetical protein
MAAYDSPEGDISVMVVIDARKHYRHELDMSQANSTQPI